MVALNTVTIWFPGMPEIQMVCLLLRCVRILVKFTHLSLLMRNSECSRMLNVRYDLSQVLNMMETDKKLMTHAHLT